MNLTIRESDARRGAARHGDGTFGHRPAEDSEVDLVGSELLNSAGEIYPLASDSRRQQSYVAEHPSLEPQAGDRLAAAILSGAASEIRAAPGSKLTRRWPPSWWSSTGFSPVG